MIFRAKLASRYIFFEMLPTFLMGVMVFIFILLMSQLLRLSELIIVHGVPIRTVAELITYLCISFIPATMPISLLFSVLLTYGRLSGDSEVVAMKALGLNIIHLIVPALVLSFMIAFASAYTSFYGAPWGNRAFEVLVTRLGDQKAMGAIKEGTFAEGFFDLVLYADKVDSKNGILKKVFIYDERDSELPLTVIAEEGRLLNSVEDSLGNRGTTLRLINGNIHRVNNNTYTKVDFKAYDINLSMPSKFAGKDATPPSWSLDDIEKMRDQPDLKPEQRRVVETEFHKRWAMAAACLVFGILGVGVGTVTNKRAVRSSGMAVSLAIMMVYWIMYIAGDSLARKGALPPLVAMWIPNILFGGYGLWTLKRSW